MLTAGNTEVRTDEKDNNMQDKVRRSLTALSHDKTATWSNRESPQQRRDTKYAKRMSRPYACESSCVRRHLADANVRHHRVRAVDVPLVKARSRTSVHVIVLPLLCATNRCCHQDGWRKKMWPQSGHCPRSWREVKVVAQFGQARILPAQCWSARSCASRYCRCSF